MYVKFQNAAVYVGEESTRQTPPCEPKTLPLYPTEPSKTLWANRPFNISRGRVVAVKKTGHSIQVGLVKSGNTSVVWVSPDEVLTQAQTHRWLSTSSFHTK